MGWLSGYGAGAGYREPFRVPASAAPGSLLEQFPLQADTIPNRAMILAAGIGGSGIRDSLRVTLSDGTTELDFHAEGWDISKDSVATATGQADDSIDFDAVDFPGMDGGADLIDMPIRFGSGITGLSPGNQLWIRSFEGNAGSVYTYTLSATQGGSIHGLGLSGPATAPVRYAYGRIHARIPDSPSGIPTGTASEWFRLYFKASGTSAEDENGVWDAVGATPGDCKARFGWDTDAHDSTSNNHDATLVDDATASGGVLDCDGDGDYAQIGNHVDLETEIDTPFTVLMVVTPRAIEERGFVGKFAAVNSFDGWSVGMDASGKLQILTNGNASNNNYLSAGVAFTDDVVSTVAARIEFGSGNPVKGYVDGIELISVTDDNTVMTEVNPMRIGMGYQDADTNSDAAFRECQYWQSDLSADWIAFASANSNPLTHADTIEWGDLEVDEDVGPPVFAHFFECCDAFVM